MRLKGFSLSPTKEVGFPTLGQSVLFRWIWHAYTERLTKAGRWLIWPTAIFMAYGGQSLQIQGYVVFSYLFGIWVVALAAMLLLRPRVVLKVEHAQRVCAGETMPVDVEVEQVGWWGGVDLMVLPHRLPAEVDAVPANGAEVPALKRGEKGRVRLGLSCPRRGVYTVRGFRIESDFPFGLINASRLLADERVVMVYPKFTRLTQLQLPTGRRYHPGGVALASSLGESFEFIGNREYRDGDSIRDIDWRATARLCRPIVREYRDEYYLRVAVVLDTHIPKGAKEAVRDSFERAVSISAAISDYMARQEYLVDIFAAGPNLYHLTAGRSLAYLDQILDILACVKENPAEPFQVIEPEIMENLSRITTVICVFLNWNEARRDFVHRLRQQGAGVKVVIVRDGACTLDPLAEGDLAGPMPVLSRGDFERGIEEI